MTGLREPAHQADEAQQAINAALELLTHPNAAHLQESYAKLEQARRLLEQINLPANADPCLEVAFLRTRFFELRKSISLAKELLQCAAEFYESWQQLRRAMETGYGNTNSTGTAPAPGRLVHLEA